MSQHMNEVLKEIYATKRVSDEAGNEYELRGSISIDEGEFLASLIHDHGMRRSVEVGCAFGLSSLFICEALAETENPFHLVIDPRENTNWHGVGMHNLRRAGYAFAELVEEGSEIVLPRLVSEGQRFDFGFIDGYHTFDHTLIDLFYMNLLIEPGGIIAIHDIPWKSVSRAVNYVSNYPCYDVVGAVPAQKTSKRRMVNRMRRAVGAVARLFPAVVAEEIFNGSLLGANLNRIAGASLLALQKTKVDERSWDWYAPV